jgi:hypothetical protein
MQLNGWQRLGVIASIIWIIFAVMNHLGNHDKLAISIYNSQFNACTIENMDVCSAAAQKNILENLKYWDAEKVDMALSVLIPLFLAWISAYLAVFLVRWVRSGFSKN